ncbi:lytic transglycosylase domain-containing protein [Conyzicola sp.]|uniref:lytic transglycosylase domain-containing protein n=1 Tax=Conyzicola sp. TaxID=1969404 RepID=UPI003988C445
MSGFARFAVYGGIVLILGAAVMLMRLTSIEAPEARMAAAAAAPIAAAAPAAPNPAALVAPTDRIDPLWAAQTGAAAGIPTRAIVAYASADLSVDAEQPGCGLGWNTIAAIGAIESVHATIDGTQLDTDGYPSPAIRGPALNGRGFAAIADTEDGVWDGDAAWDRAVGPMQFIPSTWADWAADGNGDGITDPNQIDDAALATARYLCATGDLSSPQNWRAAVFSYNHLESYVDDVAAMANRYATAAGGH